MMNSETEAKTDWGFTMKDMKSMKAKKARAENLRASINDLLRAKKSPTHETTGFGMWADRDDLTAVNT